MIYIVPAVLFLMLAIKNYGSNQKVWYIISLLIVILIPALRFRVGGDTLVYMNEYEMMPSLKELSLSNINQFGRYQPIWILVVALCKSIYPDFVVLQIFHAVFVNIVVLKFFKKYSINVFLSIFIFFLNAFFKFNYEVIRESLAIAVFLLGLNYCFEKKWIKYYAIALVCFLIHDSALILFFLPPCCSIKVNRKTSIILMIVTIFFLAIAPYIMDTMASLSFITDVFFNRANGYMRRLEEYNTNAIIYRLIITTIIPYIIYVYGRSLSLSHEFDNIAFFYFVIGILSSCVPPLRRFSNYQIVFSIVYLSNFISYYFSSENQYRKGLYKILIVFSFFFLFYTRVFTFHFRDTSHLVANTHYYNLFYPYHSVFAPEIDIKREQLLYEIQSEND